ELVPRDRVDVSAPLDQGPRRLELPEERSEVERREAVAGVGAGVAEALDRAEGGRVELVQGRIRREQRLDEVVAPAVARAQERRDPLVVVGGRLRRVAREELAEPLDVARCDQLED